MKINLYGFIFVGLGASFVDVTEVGSPYWRLWHRDSDAEVSLFVESCISPCLEFTLVYHSQYAILPDILLCIVCYNKDNMSRTNQDNKW